MPAAAALLWLATAQADASAAANAQQLLRAWRAAPAAAAVATSVTVRDGGREGMAVSEPCVLAWDASVPKVALRRGGLTVVIDAGRLKAGHADGDAAVDRPAREGAREWQACFAEMPWPQPALTLQPQETALSRLDPDMGDLQVTAVEPGSGDAALVTVRLKGARGSWSLAFRGGAEPRLVSAERTLDAGPRVPAGGSITWSMRFEPVEAESGLWSPPIQGRRRVDRVEDVMPRAKEAPSVTTPVPSDAPAPGDRPPARP